MVKVTGEVGAGKTMLCRVLMERLPDSVETIYLAVPSLAPDEMLATIADDLGVDVHGGNTTKLIRALQERLIATHAQGKQVVALIDGLPQTLVKCWIPCDHIPARSWALFKARDTLRGVIESLRQEARA